MKKKLKFERDNEEKKEEIYNVFGQLHSEIGKICKGKYGWELELYAETWWTKDCLQEVVVFLDYLSLKSCYGI